MDQTFQPGDSVFIKRENECIRATVIQVEEEEITVQLEDISHTLAIAKYDMASLSLCDVQDRQIASGKLHVRAD